MDPTGIMVAVEQAFPQVVTYVGVAVLIATAVVRIAPAPTATATGWWKDLYAAIHLIANFKQPPAPQAEGTPK